LKNSIQPTGNEVRFNEREMIVSKGDLSGRVTYANRCFMRISNYPEAQVLGQPHSLIRHPDMPRGVFRLLWDTLQQNREFFGLVKNMNADGDHYWVFANITPDRDLKGNVTGYYSVRRAAPLSAVRAIEPVYRKMLEMEAAESKTNAPLASLAHLLELAAQQGLSYDQFVLGLYQQGERQ
jgi:PAS domain S-box-containing protein